MTGRATGSNRSIDFSVVSDNVVLDRCDVHTVPDDAIPALESPWECPFGIPKRYFEHVRSNHPSVWAAVAVLVLPILFAFGLAVVGELFVVMALVGCCGLSWLVMYIVSLRTVKSEERLMRSCYTDQYIAERDTTWTASGSRKRDLRYHRAAYDRRMELISYLESGAVWSHVLCVSAALLMFAAGLLYEFGLDSANAVTIPLLGAVVGLWFTVIVDMGLSTYVLRSSEPPRGLYLADDPRWREHKTLYGHAVYWDYLSKKKI